MGEGIQSGFQPSPRKADGRLGITKLYYRVADVAIDSLEFKRNSIRKALQLHAFCPFRCVETNTGLTFYVTCLLRNVGANLSVITFTDCGSSIAETLSHGRHNGWCRDYDLNHSVHMTRRAIETVGIVSTSDVLRMALFFLVLWYHTCRNEWLVAMFT